MSLKIPTVEEGNCLLEKLGIEGKVDVYTSDTQFFFPCIQALLERIELLEEKLKDD